MWPMNGGVAAYASKQHIHAMRTTLNIDDELLLHAATLTGIQEKTALVRLGLKALIANESAKRLAALGGTQKDLRVAPRRRTEKAN
jgi:Arc/MetJ family transcription regulator